MNKQEWKEMHRQLWADYCTDTDKRDALIASLLDRIAELQAPPGPKLGDRMVLHCEGPVVEVNEQYVVVDCGKEGRWTVEHGDPDWVKATPVA